jgi:hypothetical protein
MNVLLRKLFILKYHSLRPQSGDARFILATLPLSPGPQTGVGPIPPLPQSILNV